MRIRRLTSGPKPAARVLSYIARDVVTFHAESVANPVEAREIRRALRRRYQVIRGNA